MPLPHTQREWEQHVGHRQRIFQAAGEVSRPDDEELRVTNPQTSNSVGDLPNLSMVPGKQVLECS